MLINLEHVTVFFSEFPNIHEKGLEKFNSFDSELGWERQPNEIRHKSVKYINNGEKIKRQVTYSTDEYGSRICEIDRRKGNFSIATYGDSYCFGNEVNNQETFQHHLSQKLGVHVSNYGVGGYGLGQTLLRLQRRFDNDPADYVIIALSDRHSIRQLGSIYKHYFKRSNTWGVKPRFELKNGELRYMSCILDDKKDLLDLSQKSEYLRENDYHYNNWFKRYYITPPYSLYWLQNPTDAVYAATTAVEYTTRDRSLMSPIRNRIKPVITPLQNSKRAEQMEEYWNYRIKLEEEFTDLFCELLQEFSEFVRSRDSVPIFVPMRDPRLFQFDGHFEPLGSKTLQTIEKKCPELHIVDPRKDIMCEIDDLNSIYVRENPPDGHLNSYGGELYAKYITQFITNHRQNNPESKNK